MKKYAQKIYADQHISFAAAHCDYCGKLAIVRMIGNDLVCDKCLGTVEQGAEETELERCTR